MIKTLADASCAKVTIKEEPKAEYLEVKQTLSVLKTCKGALERVQNTGLDLECQLNAKAKKDPALAGKALEVTQAMQGMERFIKTIREDIAAAECLEEDSDLFGVLSNMKALLKEGIDHQDGYKMLAKRMKVFL